MHYEIAHAVCRSCRHLVIVAVRQARLFPAEGFGCCFAFHTSYLSFFSVVDSAFKLVPAGGAGGAAVGVGVPAYA